MANGARSDLLKSHKPNVSVKIVAKLELNTKAPDTNPRADGATFKALPRIVKATCSMTAETTRVIRKQKSMTQLPFSPATKTLSNLDASQNPKVDTKRVQVKPTTNVHP